MFSERVCVSFSQEEVLSTRTPSYNITFFYTIVVDVELWLLHDIFVLGSCMHACIHHTTKWGSTQVSSRHLIERTADDTLDLSESTEKKSVVDKYV